MSIKTLKQIKNLKNKRVLVRVDFNVPVKEGKVKEDARLLASIPTIEYLVKKGAKVILVSHLGRPEGVEKKYSLRPVAERLEEISDFRFRISDLEIAKEEINKIKIGEILVIDNIRFYDGERKNDKKFAKELASLADYFVLDGFAVAHRDSPSVTGVAKYLPSYAGFLLEKEITGLNKVIQKPKKPLVVVIGGAKMETKIPVLKKLLPKANFVLIGGGIFNTCLWAKGYEIGKSLIDKDYKKEALKLLKNKKVILPVDVVVGKIDGSKFRVVNIEKKIVIKAQEAIFDVGPKTIKLFSEYIKKAQTLVWNGAMGYFEQKPYDVGTLSMARLVAARSKGKAFGVIGGGETLQAMEMVKMTEFVDLVSTGGGAMLEFLSGKKLPGVRVVSKK